MVYVERDQRVKVKCAVPHEEQRSGEVDEAANASVIDYRLLNYMLLLQRLIRLNATSVQCGSTCSSVE